MREIRLRDKRIIAAGAILLYGLLGLANVTLAQKQYKIIAAKGRSGLIRTPVDQQLSVGDQFFVIRRQAGLEMRVARVRVALVDRKYCGLKIVEPIGDNKLLKGDILVIEKKISTFEERMRQFDSLVSPAKRVGESGVDKTGKEIRQSAQLAVKNPENPPITSQQESGKKFSRPGRISGVSDDRESQQAKSSIPAAGRTDFGLNPEVVLINQARPILGLMVSSIIPVTDMANIYDLTPQFGLQLISLLRGRTNLRLSIQAASLTLNPVYRRNLKRIGYEQSTFLAIITGSLQPHISNHLFLDLGTGLYRQLEKRKSNGQTITTTINALGTIAGVGIQFNIRQSYRLLFLATGNLYFPKNQNTAFLSFAISWMFAL